MKNKKGFTLIELLAVIIILGILMIIAIPSVTSYISDSRKSAYVDTAKEIVGGVRNIVNNGNLGMYDTNTTYYIPISCVITENGVKSPYGEFTKAYIGVIYDGNGYDYYWISNDDAGQGIKNITPLDELDIELIESDIKDEDIINIVETTGIKEKEFILILEDNCNSWNDSIEAINNVGSSGKEAIFLTGLEINVKMKTLSGSNPENYKSRDTNITAINYSSAEPTEANKEEKNIVSLSTSDYPIYMWYDGGIIYWWSEDKTPALNDDSSGFFYNITSLSNIDGVSNFDASNSTNFDHMFAGNPKENIMSISSLEPLKKWNTSKVTNMDSMFLNNQSLTDLSGLENWNVSSVKNMSNMFRTNKSLLNLDALSRWNTSSLENMGLMFRDNALLTNMDGIKNWNVSKVTTMRQLFCNDINLEIIDLSNWKTTSSLTSINNMFGMWTDTGSTRLDSKLKRIYLSNKFDTSNVTDMYALLANNTKIEDYSFLQYLNTSSVTNMKQMFQYNYGLKSLEYLRNWDVSSVVQMTAMFISTTSLTDSSAINDWNIINVTEFLYMFYDSGSHPTFTKVLGTWSYGTFTPN